MGNERTADLFDESLGAADTQPSTSRAVRKPKPRGEVKEGRLIEAGTAISLDAPASEEMAYMHSVMCQVGLPRSKVEGIEFERKSGRVILSVRAGKVYDPNKNELLQQPIPYGPMPRLILAYLNAQALRRGVPEIPIGDSASDFMKLLGVEPHGGKRGSYTTFKRQAQALAACDLTLGYPNANGDGTTEYRRPIQTFTAWGNVKAGPGQRALWPGVMVLSDSYFKALTDHAVPFDVRAYMALRGSAMAMDIYTMFAERLHRIKGDGVFLRWSSARGQFGQEYGGKDPDKNFRREFLRVLDAVKVVYPQARVEVDQGGLWLKKSPPPIPYRA